MVLRILAVCTANVCRSPMAAALLQRHLEAHDVEVVATSAGLFGGRTPVDASTAKVMEERGLDIAAHFPRPLDRSTVMGDGADLILAMTRDHLREVAVMGPGVFARSFTAKELARRSYGVMFEPGVDTPTFAAWRDAVGAGRLARTLMSQDLSDDVADPYGGPLAEYRRTADELDELTSVIARSISTWLLPR